MLESQISWRHQLPKHETSNKFYCITWEVNTVWYEIWPNYVILQKKKFYQKIPQNVAWKLFPVRFFSRILCEKELEESSCGFGNPAVSKALLAKFYNR